jgi:hypothetical protein
MELSFLGADSIASRFKRFRKEEQEKFVKFFTSVKINSLAWWNEALRKREGDDACQGWGAQGKSRRFPNLFAAGESVSPLAWREREKAKRGSRLDHVLPFSRCQEGTIPSP